MSACRRMQVDSFYYPVQSSSPTVVKDLNTKADTLNLIENEVWSSLECIHTGTTSPGLDRVQYAGSSDNNH